MDISPVGSTTREAPAATSGAPRADLNEATIPVEASPKPVADRTSQALEVFRAELRLSLKARFLARVDGHPSSFGSFNASNVVSETLETARLIAAEKPVFAKESLDDLRERARGAADLARDLVPDDDFDQLDRALSAIDRGLEELESDVSANRESSASVLSVDARSKQRSTIRIRTQEGDVVRFDLRVAGRFRHGSADTDLVRWRASYAHAVAEARESGKLLLVVFGADWCLGCIQMKTWVYSDKQVADTIDAGFVPLHVDMTREGLPDQFLADRYFVQGYPTLLILDPEGKPISGIAGGLTKTDFLMWLDHTRATEAALDGPASLSTTTHAGDLAGE